MLSRAKSFQQRVSLSIDQPHWIRKAGYCRSNELEMKLRRRRFRPTRIVQPLLDAIVAGTGQRIDLSVCPIRLLDVF